MTLAFSKTKLTHFKPIKSKPWNTDRRFLITFLIGAGEGTGARPFCVQVFSICFLVGKSKNISLSASGFLQQKTNLFFLSHIFFAINDFATARILKYSISLYPKALKSFLIALSSEILLNICLLHSQSLIGTQSQSVGPMFSDFGFKPTKIEKIYLERG